MGFEEEGLVILRLKTRRPDDSTKLRLISNIVHLYSFRFWDSKPGFNFVLGDELNFSSLKGMVNAVGGTDTLEGVTKHKYLVKTTYAFL